MIKAKKTFGTDELLKLESVKKEKDFLEWIEENYTFYRESYKAFYVYFNNIHKGNYPEFIFNLEQNVKIHPEVVDAIKAHETIE